MVYTIFSAMDAEIREENEEVKTFASMNDFARGCSRYQVALVRRLAKNNMLTIVSLCDLYPDADEEKSKERCKSAVDDLRKKGVIKKIDIYHAGELSATAYKLTDKFRAILSGITPVDLVQPLEVKEGNKGAAAGGDGTQAEVVTDTVAETLEWLSLTALATAVDHERTNRRYIARAQFPTLLVQNRIYHSNIYAISCRCTHNLAQRMVYLLDRMSHTRGANGCVIFESFDEMQKKVKELLDSASASKFKNIFFTYDRACITGPTIYRATYIKGRDISFRPVLLAPEKNARDNERKERLVQEKVKREEEARAAAEAKEADSLTDAPESISAGSGTDAEEYSNAMPEDNTESSES